MTKIQNLNNLEFVLDERNLSLLLKRSYRIEDGQCISKAANPLLYNFRDENLEPRLQTGTDYWPHKNQVDLIIQGHAWAPGGEATQSFCTVELGQHKKEIAIFGKREILFSNQGPLISEPEPFEKMALTWSNAYGGIDFRVPVGTEITPESIHRLHGDHPGLYPRNPFGKGYLVDPTPVEGMEMPNLEDPTHRLTTENIILGSPDNWGGQPQPACFDWIPINSFPRQVYFDGHLAPWHACKNPAELIEVQRGQLPANYRISLADSMSPHPTFFQGAAPSLRLNTPPHGQILYLQGFTAEGRPLEIQLPEQHPQLEVECEGHHWQPALRLHHLVVNTDTRTLDLLFATEIQLHRAFIPGIHGLIPIKARVDGTDTFEYDTPQTMHAQLNTTIQNQPQ